METKGNSDGKLLESHKIAMGIPCEKPIGFHRKIGRPCESHMNTIGKAIGKHKKSTGQQQEIHRGSPQKEEWAGTRPAVPPWFLYVVVGWGGLARALRAPCACLAHGPARPPHQEAHASHTKK